MIDFEDRRDELLAQIEEMSEQKQYAALRDLLVDLEPADIASLFEDISEESVPLLFRLLPKEPAAEVFVELEPDAQEMLIRGFSNTELKEVLDELYLDDAVDIVEEMPANVVRRILKHADPETRKSINEILKYPEDSAGSLMTTEFLDLKRTMTMEDAFKRIRRQGEDMETINVCYVRDEQRHLLGIVSIRALLLADEDATVEEVMDPNVVSVNTLDDKEEVAQMFSKYDFIAMPVVDKENRLVGIITVDDAIDVMEEEVTEDFEKMAAMLPSEHPYLHLSPFEIWKNRIPWLLLLMVSATMTGIVITRFENALDVLPCLTAFIPMLMDTGGNCGSQACVTIIRGISINEIEFKDVFKVVWKEIRVAVMCGIVLSIVCFGKVMLVDHMIMHNTSVTPTVALVVSLSLAMTVFVAKMVGSTLPLLAKKVGLDPAVMASPLITTIVDLLSLLVYFSLAMALLGI